MANKSANVDAWIDHFFRTRLSLAAPQSKLGLQLDSLQRLSKGSDNKPISKVESPDNWTQRVNVKDDSGYFNASYRADKRFSDYAADLLIWASLTETQQQILEMQWSPIMCPGAGSSPRFQQETDPGYDKQLESPLRCPRCVRTVFPKMLDGNGRIVEHPYFVAVKKVRRTASYQWGTGDSLGQPVRDESGQLTEYHNMVEWERPRITYETIAETLGLKVSRVHYLVTKARALIGEKMLDKCG